ncbi:hypothetical protein [Pantoea brenneri]|uniref:hypothetical protein n=1 Tax=Pantoea brenneri TaxID=472694 RepID=UPI000851CA5F|nr:hypothetical protein [Pantoea brenneri]
MKAVIYNGPYDVKVKDVPDAKILIFSRLPLTVIPGQHSSTYPIRNLPIALLSIALSIMAAKLS